jgi:hypothetical protein
MDGLTCPHDAWMICEGCLDMLNRDHAHGCCCDNCERFADAYAECHGCSGDCGACAITPVVATEADAAMKAAIDANRAELITSILAQMPSMRLIPDGMEWHPLPPPEPTPSPEPQSFDLGLLTGGLERLRQAEIDKRDNPPPPDPHAAALRRLGVAQLAEQRARVEVIDAERYRQAWGRARRVHLLAGVLILLMVAAFLFGALTGQVSTCVAAAVGAVSATRMRRTYRGARGHWAGSRADLRARDQDWRNGVEIHDRKLAELAEAEAALPPHLVWPELHPVPIDPVA